MRILVGTEDGLHQFGGTGASPMTIQHPGRAVGAIAPGPRYQTLWAIFDETDVCSRDGSGGWKQVASLKGDGLRGNCIADTGPGVLIGTSEARLYRVQDARVEAVHPFDKAPGRDDWYTPWGGPPDSRSISEDSESIYVNVHVGGILRSSDGLATWEPTIDVDADVHRVWAVDDQVFAACARGLAFSKDRGDSWKYRTDGLHAVYCRGVALAGDSVIVSASTGPRGGRAALYRGAIDGGPLERCRAGLPEWFDGNIDSSCLDALPLDGAVAFGTSDGRVFASTDEGGTWTEAGSGLPEPRCVLLFPS